MTKKSRCFSSSTLLALMIVAILTLSACTHSRIPSQANRHVDHLNIQHRQDVANQLFKQRDYHSSLIQWEILHSIQPDNPQYKNRIRVLQTLIKRRLKTHLNAANSALSKNNIKTAELEFLKVLALAPKHKEAINAVKKIVQKREEIIQEKRTQKQLEKQIALNKVEENNATDTTEAVTDEENDQTYIFLETGISLFNKQDWRGSIRETTKYLNTNPSSKKAIDILIVSHLNLSKKFEERGHLEPAIQHMEDLISLSKTHKEKYTKKLTHLKQKLSANYYIDGIKVYRDNIDQAISYWKRAVETNPNNEKAKIRLRKAVKMREKLNTMRSE